MPTDLCTKSVQNIIAVVLSVVAGSKPALAIDTDGWCIDDGGNVGIYEPIKDNVYYSIGEEAPGVPDQCVMANPIPVRDMQATLYDVVCYKNGEVFIPTHRELLIRTSPSLMLWIGGMFQPTSPITVKLERCKCDLGPGASDDWRRCTWLSKPDPYDPNTPYDPNDSYNYFLEGER